MLILFLWTGGDATENFEDVGHSSDARALMLTYLIGEIVDVNIPFYKMFSVVLSRSLLSNSENLEHPKNFRNVDCVLANRNKVQDMRANLKPQINYHCCLGFSYLAPYWLISRNTIAFHKYFWCSWFCEFHSNNCGTL